MSIQADDVRRIEAFSRLGDERLQWLIDNSETIALQQGDVLFKNGDRAEYMYVLLEGSVRVQSDKGETVFEVHAPDIFGVLPNSRMDVFNGTGYSLAQTRIMALHKLLFFEMIDRMPALGPKLAELMSDRIRDQTTRAQQREKMVSLGKLSAGLAHELNNPAAAVRRTAVSLRSRLEQLPEQLVSAADPALNATWLEQLQALLAAAQPSPLSTLARSEREDALLDWLETQGLDNAWQFAETLVEAGIDETLLEQYTAPWPTPAGLQWLEFYLAVRSMLQDIESAAERISGLVGSIKSYTHMDRAADKQATDIRAGLDNTLAMLGHKLKAKNIGLEKDYPDDLPQVPAYPGELNQVWTNLIDNAVDAMDEGGKLVILIKQQEAHVAVHIIDSGPGIPEQLRQRIFEPFFTTKGVGEGTGLGLDIAHNIIRKQHRGEIRLDSRPGHTEFTVTLPLS